MPAFFAFSVFIIFSLTLAGLLVVPRVSAWSSCALDPNNLVVNGSMAAAIPDNGVVANWNAFILSGSPTFEHVNNEQIDANGSQYIWSDGSTFDAGIYQTVTGLTPGAYYHFQWGYALAAYDPHIGPNLRWDKIGRRLGVDLTGGTNALSTNVIWGNVYWDGNAALNLPALARTFAAQTDRATFFLRNINTDSQWRDKVWMDAICMEPTTAPPGIPRANLPLVMNSFVPPVTCTASNVATVTVGTHPKGIAADPTTNRIFVGLFDNSSVAVINAATNQLLTTWTTNNGGHSNGVGVTGGKVFVSLRDTSSVAVLDASTGAFIANLGVGTSPYGVGAANGKVWVANYDSSSVSVLDAATTNVSATTTVGINPSLIAPASDRAFVSYWDNGVAVVGSNGASINNFTASGGGSFGVAFNATANRLYVSNRIDNKIFALNANTGETITSVTLSPMPYALAYNPSSNHLFVVLADTDQVEIRDGTTLSSIGFLSIAAQGRDGGDAMAVMNGRIYVSNNAAGTISVLGESCPSAPK